MLGTPGTLISVVWRDDLVDEKDKDCDREYNMFIGELWGGTWPTGRFHWSDGLSNFQCHLKRAIQRLSSSALKWSRGIELVNNTTKLHSLITLLKRECYS